MSSNSTKLYWENPLLQPDFVADLTLIISPFATASALRELFKRVPPPKGLQLVTTWSSDSLLRGASDPEIFRIVEDYDGRLYLHDTIHLKLYVCSSRHAVLSTGNLTGKGLGFASRPNIEASSIVELEASDWDQISAILAESRRVTEEIYRAAVEFCVSNKRQASDAPEFKVPKDPTAHGTQSWLTLPACKDPRDLWEYYSGIKCPNTPEEKARIRHDLQTFEVPSGLDEASFYRVVGRSFLRLPLVNDLANWINRVSTASFGAVKAWLQENCSDKPTPYRWELTLATQALYDWLKCFHPNITWNRPNHSQILIWQDKRGT